MSNDRLFFLKSNEIFRINSIYSTKFNDIMEEPEEQIKDDVKSIEWKSIQKSEISGSSLYTCLLLYSEESREVIIDLQYLD